MLPLTWLHNTCASESIPNTDAPVNLPLSMPSSTHQTSTPPSALLGTTAAPAWSLSNIAPPSSNVTAPQDVLALSPGASVPPGVIASHAVARQDTPQHAVPMLEQPQHATPRADAPQPATPQAAQPRPAAKSAAVEEGELSLLNSDSSQRSEPQPATSEVVTTAVAGSSGAAQPQLATSVEAPPQPAMMHFLDLLFPAEQLPTQLPSSPPADSQLTPALAETTGQAETLLDMPLLPRFAAFWRH